MKFIQEQQLQKQVICPRFANCPLREPVVRRALVLVPRADRRAPRTWPARPLVGAISSWGANGAALVLPSPLRLTPPNSRKIQFPFILLCGFILTKAMLAQEAATPKGEPTMTVSEPVHTDVFRGGEDGYHTYRIPSIIATLKGTLIAFCEGRKENRRDQSPTDMVLKRSVDGGKKWMAMQVVVKAVPDAAMDPCPLVDRTTGVIWLVYDYWPHGFQGKKIRGLGPDAVSCWVTHSADDGVTWAAPVNITPTTKKPHWSGVAHGPGVGIQTRSGRLIVPSNQHADGRSSLITYSDDHGKTWQLGGEVGPAVGESQVVELADGTYMLNMRSTRAMHRRAIATSADGGKTWSPIHDDPTLIEPVCQGSFIRYTLAAEHGRNRLLFCNPGSEQSRVNGTVRLSYDEGQTWPIAKTLVPGSFAYNCLTVFKDMTVGCLYETDSYGRIRFTRFTLDWLTDGADRIEGR
jgi:sialidase-1